MNKERGHWTPSQMFSWALNMPLHLTNFPFKNADQHQEDGRWTST